MSQLKIKYFSGVWPVFGLSNESGSCRIIFYINPFFRIRLVASQNVIEKPFLPVRWRLVNRSEMRRKGPF